MKYLRFISIFNKSNDFISEQRIELDDSILKEIFDAYPNDPELIMVYPINESTALKLSQYLYFEFDFNQYIYEMITYDNT